MLQPLEILDINWEVVNMKLTYDLIHVTHGYEAHLIYVICGYLCVCRQVVQNDSCYVNHNTQYY